MVSDETTRHVHDLDQIDLVAVRGRAGIFPRQLAAVGKQDQRAAFFCWMTLVSWWMKLEGS
jgi:hypothetical protein